MDEELVIFADSVRRFAETRLGPDRLKSWREARMVPREAWSGFRSKSDMAGPEAISGMKPC